MACLYFSASSSSGTFCSLPSFFSCFFFVLIYHQVNNSQYRNRHRKAGGITPIIAYCRTGFNSAGLMAMKMIAIVGIGYRNCTHYTLYRSCLLIYGIAIIRLLSFLFLDDFEGNANISVTIKSSSTAFHIGDMKSRLFGSFVLVLHFN